MKSQIHENQKTIKTMSKTIKISILASLLGLMSFTVLPTTSKIQNIETTTTPIAWKSESIDLGEIPQNKPKEVDFEFKKHRKNCGDYH